MRWLTESFMTPRVLKLNMKNGTNDVNSGWVKTKKSIKWWELLSANYTVLLEKKVGENG